MSEGYPSLEGGISMADEKMPILGAQIFSRRPKPTDAGLRNVAPRRLDLEPPMSMGMQSEGSYSACSCAYVNKTRVVLAQPGDFISARLKLDAVRRSMMRYPYAPGVPR